MNKLSIEIKKYALLTYSKSVYFLTDKQELQLRRIGFNDTIDIDGNKIKGANIAEIMTISEYKRQHPEKIEQHLNYPKLPEYERANFDKKRRVRALSEMVRGFKEYFGDRILPPQSQKLLDHMEAKIEEAKNAPDNKKFNNPIMDMRTQFFNN